MDNNSVRIEPKLAAVKELVECCPQGHNLLNLECPFRNIRKLNEENQKKVLGSMSVDEVDAIIDYHKDCRAAEIKLFH